ncbi:hypothetical protein GFV12_08480 (plasmid) [Desulfurobacterium thermolithotrophum]|uniref:hypothetical protein n=1 Tax=Desulfurobacterium thermolithotrophum TaxID=64160 RepID=UPI0013D6925F|nr:hypothetical protein [Desulfurobacterium thermolithotrophum]
MLKKLMVFVVFSILSFAFVPYAFGGNDENAVWYGVYTIDDLPDTLAKSLNCKIVNMGNYLSASEMFILSEPNKPLRNCDNCYLNYIDESIQNCTNSVVKNAKKLGYNAILGLKVIIASHFDGFQGAIVNGNRGVGYGYVNVMGTPVTLQCYPTKNK